MANRRNPQASAPEAPEVPLEELVEAADAEGLELEDATDEPAEPAELSGRYVVLKYPTAVRGVMVSKFLESAERLGLDPHSVRTVSGGLKVPREIAADQFPSQFAESE